MPRPGPPLRATEGADRIRAAFREAIEDGDRLGLGRPTALGWATVELDRAALDLAALLGLTAGAFVTTDGSDLLGAHCRVAHDGVAAGLDLAIIEPSLEGRLAAALARHDEGPAAVWFTPGDEATLAVDGAAPTMGPFGPERLVRPGPADPSRWFLLVVGPGTIDR